MANSVFRIVRTMEHMMLSYPLKFVLGHRTYGLPACLRRAVVAMYSLAFPFDRLIPVGGLDVTVFR